MIAGWGFDCVQNALYTRDNKPICLKCSKKEASTQANYASREVYALKRRLIICIVILFAGIIAFNIPNENEPALKIFAMIGVWCFANIGSVYLLFLDQLIALMKP
ncbi:MAG: hypothetical protein SOZ73_07730 [Campylobacter sp.]|nr:hypothetical protein [Campylobacter sp.]